MPSETQMRFTPAHAGNTKCGIAFTGFHQVHPRSRGEYLLENPLCSFDQGSPPLTRGILISTGLKIKVLRFTPAHAGNTDLYPTMSGGV